MLHSLKERFDREDEGFTLIELMVVVLIIAILLAIAIPTFLGARDAANARSAQSDLRNALTAEQTYWTNNQSWDVAPATGTAGSVAATETSLTWLCAAGCSGTGPVMPGSNILVTDDTAANNAVILTAASKNNHCYSIEVIDQPGGTVGFAAGTYYYDDNTQTTAGKTGCTAPGGLATGTSIKTSAAASPNNWSSAF